MLDLRLILVALLAPVAAHATTSGILNAEIGCPGSHGVALQVLGSGGPIADDARASSGYLVWVDGAAKALIDVGGGTFLRFGEAGARFEDLDFIGLSHFHTDHSADFPALLKSGSFTDRKRDLVVAGPDGRGPFPGLNAYLEGMLDPSRGAYRYLSGYLGGTGGLPQIDSIELPAEGVGAVTVFSNDKVKMRIDSMHVPHGIVPALAFRVSVGKTSIVFASDQNGGNNEFIEFAQGANVLVMHLVVPEGTTGIGRRLHAPPSVIGTIAQAAGVDALVLSHFMARSLRDLDVSIAIIESKFDGRVILANDLDCIDT